MDMSEEYVEMCRKAYELQKNHVDVEGDIISALMPMNDGSYIQFVALMGTPASEVVCSPIVWLPKQDQLQNMCTELKLFKPIYSLSYVTMWAEAQGFDCGANDYAESLNSLEQVWLAYVMDENYHKKWNGSEWVKA